MQDPFKPVGYRPAPPPVASRSRWRWVLIVLFFLIALAGSAVVLGPSLIDWNAYKAPFAEAVRRATGRELVVAGDLSLELLPRPRLVARDVSLGNALGGSQPEMVRVGRLEARLAPWPLLSGRFELRSLDLIEPTILLERLSDGAGNWEGVVEHLSQEGRQGRLRLALEHVRIAGGTALWRGRDGSVRKLEKVDASLTAPPLGPAAIAGTGRVGETPLRFEAALPAGAQGGPVRVLVSAGDGEAEASGALLGGEAFGYTGKLRVKSASLARSLTALALVDAPLPAGMDQPLSAEAEVKIGGSRLEASSLRIEFGGAVAGGKGALDFDARRAQLELAMSRLDLDAWPKNESGAAWPISFPAGWSGEGRLSIEALVWQAGIISQVRAAARLEEGRIALDEVRALLPGGSEVTVVAALEPAGERSWRWSGRLTAASDNLRGVLQWLGAEPAGVPADRLRKLSLKARLSGAGSNLQVSEIDAQLDGSHITGGVAAVLRARPGLGIGLSIDEVNLDAYLPRDGAPGQPEEPAKTESLFGRLDANFNLALGSLTYGGQRLQSLRAEGTLQNGNLDLKQLAAQTPSGGNARLAGRVGAIASKEPDINLDFDLSARNGAELIQLAGLPEAKQRIGSMSISGTAVGKPGAVKVDLAVVAAELQAEAKVVGAVAAFRPSLLGSGKVKAELREPAKLAGLLQIEPARLAGFGPVSIEGELGRDGTNLSVDLTLTAAEAGLTAQLAGARAGAGKDASLEGRLELSAENGRPVLLALGIDPTRAPSGPVSARLTASGPVRDLAVDGEAQAAEIRASLRGRVGFEERRSYQLEVTAAHPDLPRLASLFRMEAIPLPGELKLQGTLAGSDERLALALDRSQFGPLSASGQGEIEFKDPRPRVKLALSLGELPLPALLAPFRARAKDQTIGAGWSTRPVGWNALTRLDAEATVSAERAVAGRVRIDAPKVELVLEEGRLALRKFEGEIAKGTWSATGAIVPAGRDTVALTLSVKGAEIGQTPDWAGLSLTRGRLELGLDLTSRGASAVELVQGLAGGGRLRIEDGSLRGVDLTKLSKLPAPEPGDPAPDANAITGALEGETAFDALEAAIAVERGVIRTADLAAMAPAATLRGALSLDLLKWQTEGAFEARSVERPELPALEIAIAGPLDDPQLEMDASALAAALTPAPEPEPQIEPAPAPAPEPSAPQPAPAPQPEPAAEQPAPEPQPAPAPPAQPPQPPAPAPAPKAEPGADAFVKGILEKLKKPQQP